jgi:hypothetical protein
LRIQGSGFRLRVQDLEFKIYGLGFGFEVESLGVRV